MPKHAWLKNLNARLCRERTTQRRLRNHSTTRLAFEVLEDRVVPSAAVDFAAAQTFPTGGTGVYSVATADFNNDGHTDLAAVNFNNASVGVLLGDGLGGFGAVIRVFNNGAQPLSIAVADFDGDGRSDLAVANLFSNTVGMLRGNGDGTFASPVTFASGGSGARSIAVADFNGDGRPDLVVAHNTSANVGVLLGNGAAGFATAATFASGGVNTLDVAVGDLNNDGKADIAVANGSGSNTVGVLLGNGLGGFATAATFASGGASTLHVTVGDLNNDDRADLVASNFNSANVGVLLGNGTGGFATAATFATSQPAEVAVGDFNNDSRADLAVVNQLVGVSVLLGNGLGGFAASVTFGTGGGFPYPVAAADFDNDGRTDLAVGDWNNGTVGSLRNTTVTNRPPIAAPDAATTPQGTPILINVLANDTDADGDMLTVLVADAESSNGGSIHLNDDGRVSFTPRSGFHGVDSFHYTITDGLEDATGTVSVTVTASNNPPIAVPDVFVINEDTDTFLDLTLNDIDPDHDPLTILSVAPGLLGTTQVVGPGHVLYHPGQDRFGDDSFLYVVSDLQSGTSSTLVQIKILPVNDPPTANPDAATTTAGQVVNIPVLANDTDVDGDTLVVVFTDGESANGGNMAVNNDGTVTYSPRSGFAGTDTFHYTINDGNGGIVEALVSIQVNAETPADDAQAASSQLLSGLSGLDSDVGNWGALLHAGAPNATLPVVGTDLGGLFHLDGAGGVLGTMALPGLSTASTFTDLKEKLESAGFTIDFIKGGIGGLPDGDFVQAHFEKVFTASDFSTLAASREFDDATNTQLAGLADSLNLDGLMGYDASIHLRVGVGVDTLGFYVTGDSGIELDVSGGGTITGSTPVGAQQINATGSASVDFQVKLAGTNAGARLRLGDLQLDGGGFLALRSDGLATVAADLRFSPVDMHLATSWDISMTNNVIGSLTGMAAGELSVPGLTVQQGGVATPDSVKLTATFGAGVWTVDGSFDAGSDHRLGGFLVTSFDAHAAIAGTEVSGSALGQMSADLEGVGPVDFTIDASFDDAHLDFGGATTITDRYLGAGTKLLWVDSATFTVSTHSDFTAQTTSVTVSAAATTAVLLPKAAAPGVTPDGAARATGLAGSVESSGKLHLSADTVDFIAARGIRATGGPIDITIDPTSVDPAAVIASLDDLVVTFPEFRSDSELTILALQIRRNGFDLSADFQGSSGSIGGVLAVANPHFIPNLRYNAETQALTGTIGVSASSADVFPGSTVTAHATGFNGSIDLVTGVLTLHADSLDASIGTALHVAALGVDFTFDSASLQPSAIIATIDSAMVDSPDFPQALAATAHNITIRHNGFSLDSLSIGGPDGTDLTIGTPVLLAIKGLKIDVTSFDFTVGQPLTGMIDVTGTSAELFPGRSSLVSASVSPATIGGRGFHGSYDLAAGLSSLHLTADKIAVDFGSVLIIRATHTVFDLSGDTLATIAAAEIEIPGVAAISGVELAGIVVHRSGLSIDSATLSFADTLRLPGDIADVQKLRLTLADFGLDFANPSAFAGTLTAIADSATLFPNQSGGIATLSPGVDSQGHSVPGLRTMLDASGNFTWQSGQLDANLGGVVFISVHTPTLAFGPSQTGALFTAPLLTATIPSLSNLTATFSDFALSRDGHFSLAEAHVASAGFLKTFGLADLLPVDLTSVDLVFPNHGDLNTFDLSVTGAANLANLNLPFTPILKIGDRAGNGEFSFTLAIDSLKNGIIRPKDLGPIQLGFSGLDLGTLTVGGSILLGGYSGGVLSTTAGGSFGLAGGFDDGSISGSLSAEISGTLTTTSDVTTLDVSGHLLTSFTIHDGLLVIEGADLAFGLTIVNTPNSDSAFNLRITPTFDGLSFQRVAIEAGDLFELEAAALDVDHPLTINFAPQPGELMASFGSLGFKLGDGVGPLAGWGGSAGNFGIDADGSLVLLPGVFVSIRFGDPSALGLPEWLPVHVDQLTLAFGENAAGDLLASQLTQPLKLTNPLDVSFTISGGVGGGDLPFEAGIQGLKVDILKLINTLKDPVHPQFPIVDLEGFAFGLAPFELVPGFTIGGGLKLGTVDVDADPTSGVRIERVFYGRIFGEFEFGDVGAGINLVISQYGPLAATATVPLAIPLAQTGILLSNVTGGILFGQTLPSITDPSQLSGNEFANPLQQNFSDLAVIKSMVEPSVQRHTATWSQAFTLALSGTFIHVAAPGVISGVMTLAANAGLSGPDAGVKFLGVGDVNLFGMPFATVRLLLDLSDPIAPTFAGAFFAPAPNNPLGFLIPARTEVSALFSTRGLVLAGALGTRAFISELVEGSLSVGQHLFRDTLDAIAQRLSHDPTLPLARLVRTTPSSAPFTANEITTRLLALIPSEIDDLVPALAAASNVAQAFQTELFHAASDLLGSVPIRADELAGASAGFDANVLGLFTSSASGLPIAASRDAILAFARVAREAAVAAIEQVASVASSDDLFDPILIMRGKLQPVIFGIPLGPPSTDIELTLSKRGVSFGADLSWGSVSQALALVGGPFSGPLLLAAKASAMVADMKVFASIRLPFATDAPEQVAHALVGLLNGQVPTINPLSPDWAFTVRGFMSVLGYQVGELSGIAFPSNATDLLAARMQQLFPPTPAFPGANPDTAFNPALIPVTDANFYANLVNYGGILLNGSLTAPSLLIDPFQTFAAIGAPPNPIENLGAFQTWLTSAFDRFGAVSQVAQVQAFLPSFASLLQVNELFDVETASDGPGTPRVQFKPGVLLDQVSQILHAAYFDGLYNSKILGIQLASAHVRATADSLTITGAIPWLGHLGVSFTVKTDAASTHPVTLTDGDGHPVPVSIPFPKVSAELDLDTAQMSDILGGLNLSSFVQLPTTNPLQLKARFRAYTPGFDIAAATNPASPDLMKATGGIEVSSRLSIAGLVNNAQFRIALTPPSAGSVIPDFRAAASVSQVNLPGLTISNATIEIIKNSQGTKISVDGQASILGKSAHVSGLLNPDLTGKLTIDFGSERPSIGAFDLSAGFSLTLTRNAANALRGTLSFDGTVTLPLWLAGATGQAAARAAGTISSNGNVDLLVTLTNFKFGPNQSVAIVGADNGPATFHIIRNSSGTTLSIVGKLTLAAQSGLPLLSLSGSLSDQGFGNLDLTFDTAGLNLGGFLVRGGATLTYAPTVFSIAINGKLTVPGLFNNASVTGAMDQNGIASASLSAASLNLDPLIVNSFSVTLLRRSTAPLAYRLSLSVNADIREVISGVQLNGQFDALANGTLSLSSTQLSIFGFTITNGVFTVTRSSSVFSMSIAGRVSFMNQTLTVSGSMGLANGGSTGNLTLALLNGGSFSFGGFAFTGALTLAITPSTAAVAFDGSAVIPGTGPLAASGSIGSDTLGSLAVTTGASGLKLGGTSSPFSATGSFVLSRTRANTAAPIVTVFKATNASLEWSGVATFSVPLFQFGSDGVVNVDLTPQNFSLGTGAGAMVFKTSTIKLRANAGAANYHLEIGQSTLRIPYIATGVDELVIPALDVSLSDSFSIPLLSSGTSTIDLGALQLVGRLLFERQAGVFRLAVNGTSSTSKARLIIPGLGDLTLNNFFIASNGTFSVNAAVSRVGPDALSIRNASISVAKTGAALSTFSLAIDGGQLYLPVGAPIDLPDLVINSNAHFQNDFTIPSIDLGPAFKASSATWRLALDSGVLSLNLRTDATLTALAGSASMKLTNFSVDSAGNLDGTVTGRLGIGGFQLAQATFDVSLRSNGVVRLTLPASRAVNVNLGFATVKFSGFAESDGNFSFTGSSSFSAGIPAVASIFGMGSFTISDSNFAGSFSGTITVGLLSGTVVGTISRSGVLTVNFLGITYTFQL